jgi:2-polyprenyl-3-methyl-5-hydroxy-6-metoxy-1,4-benzoquinol methylase
MHEAAADAGCPSCGDEGADDVYRIFDKKIVRCRGCRLMRTYPKPTIEELAKVYSENYFTNQDLVNPASEAIYGYCDYMAERLTKQTKYRTILREIDRYLTGARIASRDLVDIGCGFGFFLDSSVDFGFSPSGVEFNAHAIERLQRRYAFPVHKSNGTLSGLVPSGSLACVVMLDTIEHLLDPFTALDDIRAMLLPDGIVAISTMDSTSVTSRLLGARLEDFRRIHEHLFFFDRGTLRSLLERRGFEVLKVASIGHTFEAGHLLSRISASFPMFSPLSNLVNGIRLRHLKISLNPRTKMIMYARKA